MKIRNNTDLSYKVMGEMLDQLFDLPPRTHYFGQIETVDFDGKDKVVRITIRYLKSYTEFTFDYVRYDYE